MPVDPASVPDFDDLPKVQDFPQSCTWGIFDQDGVKDKFGTLNFLTPEIVQAAAKELAHQRPLQTPSLLSQPAQAQNHRPLRPRPPATRSLAWDDEIDFNTQSSSQWDSLCHFLHQPTGLTYNGVKPEAEAFAEYADQKGIHYHPFQAHRITVQDIESVASHQNVDIRPGDVLLVRTGATEVLEAVSKNPSLLGKNSGEFAGVHGVEETVRWFWNKRLAAVAGDSIAFEAFPPLKDDGTPGAPKDMYIHPHLLAMIGMPIGELWDFAKLSRYCKEKGRYSFFLTSAPLNHPGLIGSPPNALAIF
ncbi:hypothetical protein PT974_09975 [Cladobotryum mycophilum]|uniref:Cyclase n=1 Tax=Cladobotryum mycophilum TaxID=491253 RepID=A0ABR0S8J7_9HYPO